MLYNIILEFEVYNIKYSFWILLWDIVVNDKKSVLGILKNYGNFRKRTPDEFYHLKQTPG